ncbi:hypothetical protein ATCC90586_008877 [Pythium insidiosum]|nr:hypothetical protein ATCC90586_008877 [Pythium insidiosum]
MNRQTLADATTLHDAPVPIYLMEQIAGGTKASQRDAEKTADFLLGRLGKTNLIVKLKALQIIAFCIREGDAAFANAIREDEGEISAYLQYSGPPDPVMGDERYRRIRVAAQEALVCLNDGCLPRHSAPSTGSAWGGPAPAAASSSGYGQAQYNSEPSNPSSYGQATSSYNSQPWGASSAQSASRPAPYSDNPSGGPSYGGQGTGSNAGYGGTPGLYGGNDYRNNSNAVPQYGESHQPQHQTSGLSSWSTPSASSSSSYGGAPKGASGGMWSSSGYQKTKGNEVDFLGFDGLSVNESVQQSHAPQPVPNVFGSPPRAASVPQQQQQQASPHVSLLDGFDAAPQHPYQQQVHQQHSFQQQRQATYSNDLLPQSPTQTSPPVATGLPAQPQYGDLLPFSPPSHPTQQGAPVPPMQLPSSDERAKTLSNFGKDLFAIANSPRNAGGAADALASSTGTGERSAFSFM